MVKEKPNSTRIYDKDGFRRRAATICVRSEAETEVLLVTSSRRPELWIVPGGGVEPDEEAAVTAVREVLEEAGVIGKLGRCLGVFENSDHMHRTEVFVLNVTQELDEWEDSRSINRKRQWFTIEDALKQLALHKPTQQHYLMKLRHSKSGNNDNANDHQANADGVNEEGGSGDGVNDDDDDEDEEVIDGVVATVDDVVTAAAVSAVNAPAATTAGAASVTTA